MDKRTSCQYFRGTLPRKITSLIRRYREQQIAVMRALLEKRHVFSQLPTGYGKSLPFFAYPLISGSVVIVISPLRALIDNHASDAERLGFTVIQLEKLDETGSAEIRTGENIVIIGAPEALLLAGVKATLTTILTSLQSALIVLDEAHCVPKWGYSEVTGKKKTAAFRAAFSKLYVLRTMAAADHQFLFLTATATAASRTAILRAVGFRPKDVFFIVQHPVRSNITFAVQQLTASSDDEEEPRMVALQVVARSRACQCTKIWLRYVNSNRSAAVLEFKRAFIT